MKHLNANLDSITNVETNKTPNGSIRAIGVDSVNDIVAIPGVEHGSGGSTTFTTECQFIRASEIATRTDLGTGVRSTRITFAESLENLVEAGGTISFYAGADLDLTDQTVNDGAVAVVSVTVLAVATTTIDIEPITGSVDDLTTLLTSTATLIPDGQTEAQGVFFTDCIDVSVTVEGPAGGNLCVTGNILLGGQLTDKDGNPVVEMSPDGDVILGDSDGDGDIIVEGDVVGPETECTPLVDPLNTDNALRITSIEPSTIITGQPVVIKTTVPTAEFLNSIDYLEQGGEITLDCGDGKLFSATIDRTEQVTTFSDGSDEIINVMDTLLFDADLTAADCITHAATLTNLTYTTTATPSRFANLFVIPSEIANLIGTNPVAGTTALLDAPGGGDFANSRQGTVIDDWPTDITVPSMNSCSGGVAYLQGGGNAANEQFRFIVPNNTALGANNLHDITVANIDAIFGTTVAAQNFDYATNGISISQLTLRYPTDNNAANDLVISFDSTAGLQILKYYGANIFQYGTWYSFGFNNAGFTYVQGPSATNTQGQAISAFEGDLSTANAGGTSAIWTQPAASLANYLAESVRTAANWSWSSTDPNLNINFPNNAGSCNIGGALPWPYGNDLVIRLDENNTTLNYNCAAGDLRFYNTVTTITPAEPSVLESDNFCIYTIGTEAQTVFDISPEDFQNCSLTCSDGEEEVIIGGDIIVEGDEDIEGDLNIEGDIIVNGGGGDCMDVIEGITPQGFTETTDDFIFSFAPAAGTGAALLAAELRRQLAAGDIEFRYQAAQTVTQQGQTSLLTSAGTYAAVDPTSNTTLTLTGVNAAIISETTASIASDTANNTALTFLEINGTAFGIQSIVAGGVAETADILLVDGQNLLASATGDFVNLVYVGSIVTTEVVAALLVPQNSPAVAVADAGGSGMPFRVTITVPKIFYGNITAPNLNTVLVDSFGLVNCPALTTGGNVLVVGDLIITSDGDGDGGDIIIDGDIVVDGDIDTDGDITSEGDIMAADVSCTGGMSLASAGNAIQTSVFAARDIGGVVTSNVLISGIIVNPIYATVNVGDVIGLKNVTADGSTTSGVYTVTAKANANSVAFSLTSNGVTGIDSTSVVTTYFGGSCAIGPVIIVGDIVSDGDISVDGMLCQDVGATVFGPITSTVPGSIGTVVIDGVRLLSDFSAVGDAEYESIGSPAFGDHVILSDGDNRSVFRYESFNPNQGGRNIFERVSGNVEQNSGDLDISRIDITPCGLTVVDGDIVTDGDIIADDIKLVGDLTVDRTICQSPGEVSSDLLPSAATRVITSVISSVRLLEEFDLTPSEFTTFGSPTVGSYYILEGSAAVSIGEGVYEYERALLTGTTVTGHRFVRVNGNLQHTLNSLDLSGLNATPCGFTIMDGDIITDGDIVADIIVSTGDLTVSGMICNGGTFVRRTISGIDGDTPADLIVGSELEYDGSLIFFNVAGRFRDSLFALLGTETITRGEQFTIFNQSLELSGVFEVADQPGDSQTFLNFISGDLSLAALAIGQEIVIAYAAVCVADGDVASDSFTSAISTCNAATGGGFGVNPSLLQAEIIADGSENTLVISRLTLNQAPANTLNVLSGALNPDRAFGDLITVGTRFFFAESNSVTNGGVYEVTNVVLLTPAVDNNPLESITLARVSGNYTFDRLLTELQVSVFTNGTCLVGGEIAIEGVASIRGGVARRATFDLAGVATSDVGGVNTWSGTQVQYDAITDKDDSIIYYTR